MDELKKFIEENKEAFNDEQVRNKEDLWSKIEQDLKPEKKKNRGGFIFKIAASILIVAIAVGSYFQNTSTDTSSGATAENNELIEIDAHYAKLVSLKIEQIKEKEILSPEAEKEFFSFMEELDEELNVLNDELKKNLDNEVIIEAIISNYRERLRLLEMLLERAQHNNDRNENNNISL